MDNGTILVFGMPRSGTTWLGKLFDSHPSTLYRHEPDSWTKLSDVPLLPSVDDVSTFGAGIEAFEASLADLAASKVCGKTPVFPKSYLSPVQHLLYRAGIRGSQIAALLGFDMPIIGTPRKLAPDCRLVWKSIESVGRLGLVLASLPKARAILLVRHPCGYAASVIRGESQRRFQDNRGASEDYGILEQLLGTQLAQERDLSIDYFRALAPEERLAWRWALFNDQALRDAMGTGRCSVLRYEDLCADPLVEIRRNFEFTGLGWSDQTERFIESSTGHDDSAYYSVYKDPKKAAEKWREELDPQKAGRIMDAVSDTAPGSLFVGADNEAQI